MLTYTSRKLVIISLFIVPYSANGFVSGSEGSRMGKVVSAKPQASSTVGRKPDLRVLIPPACKSSTSSLVRAASSAMCQRNILKPLDNERVLTCLKRPLNLFLASCQKKERSIWYLIMFYSEKLFKNDSRS